MKIILEIAKRLAMMSASPRVAINTNENMKTPFTTVSQYIAAGALSVGFLLESPIKETEKALAFEGVKFNSYGNPYTGLIWLPKSQLAKLQNDFYTNNAPSEMWFCPTWLYAKNPTLGEKVA
jgi:hypothetical protein